MSSWTAVKGWLAVVVGLGCSVACGARSPLETGEVSPTEPPDLPPDLPPDPPPEPPDPIVMDCPTTPDDPRLPTGYVGQQFVLDGSQFVQGSVAGWEWSVVHEKCDRVLPSPRYELVDPLEPVASFRPAHPGAYSLGLTVQSTNGTKVSCQFELPILGRGLRVELCWDTSTRTDLDLYLHTPYDEAPWYTPGSRTALAGLDNSTCNPANCASDLRFGLTRADWGYEDSPVDYCDPFSTEVGFIAQGFCPNPRASTDNNQTLETGTAEVIQFDNPLDGQVFRVMVQNFDNLPAAPEVYVYCGTAQATLLGPDQPPRFQAPSIGSDGINAYGVMWRAADIEVSVDDTGATQGCRVDPLDTAGRLNVTIDDPSY